MSGLALRTSFFFWGQHDFSNELLEQRYVKELLESSLNKFYVRYGEILNSMKIPSDEC